MTSYVDCLDGRQVNAKICDIKLINMLRAAHIPQPQFSQVAQGDAFGHVITNQVLSRERD